MPQLTAGYLQVKDGDFQTLNFVLRQLQDRLDALGGDRGQKQHRARALLTEGLESQQDLIVDAGTSGLILKDTQARSHYWRVTVSNAGALVVVDIGVQKP